LKKEQEKIPENAEQKESGEVSRRDFLVGAGTVVVGGAIGAGLLSSCGETVTTTIKETSTKTVATTVTAPGTTETKTVAGEDGEVITVTETKTETEPGGGGIEPAYEEEKSFVQTVGGNNSGLVVLDVKNGKLVRCRPLHYDWKYTEEELAETKWKLEARGKTLEPLNRSTPSYFQISNKKRVYSPNRVKYPLKRVDWEPGGDPAKINPQNRGKSKFKRISWDEATDIIASEIKRVQDKYGPYGVFMCEEGPHAETKTIHASGNPVRRLMGLVGGCSNMCRNADSWEGWYWGAMHLWGTGNQGLPLPADNLGIDIAENCEMIVWFGDWETTMPDNTFGSPLRSMAWWRELGIKQIWITPDLNYSAATYNDKWIPVLAGRDDALNLAIMYTWIQEGLYDQEYLDTHAVGFDADHMPKGADPKDNFKDYVLGTYDGVPKSPEWASSRCKVPIWTIKALAREWANKATSCLCGIGGAICRIPYSTETARLRGIQMCMQGLGKPGVHIHHNTAGRVPGTLVRPNVGKASRKLKPPVSAEEKAKYNMEQFIGKVVVPFAILDHSMENPISWWGHTGFMPVEDQFEKFTYPLPEDRGGTEIHMFWSDKACFTVCWNEGYKWIEALRSPKLECVIYQHMWLENDCLFADLVLPVNTNVEEEDIFATGSEFTALVYNSGPAIEPIGESVSDYDVAVLVAEKLEKYGGRYADCHNKLTEGKTVTEWAKYGYDSSGVTNLVSWEELKEKQYWIPPTDPNWRSKPSGWRKFYEDPDKNPLPLPSGKIEIYSSRLAENFPDDNERNPSPRYVIGGPASQGWSHDESLDIENGAEKCKRYPLIMQSNHPRWRVHNQFDDVPWLREIPTCKVQGYDGYMYEPVWIHPSLAAEKGIVNGDIIKIFNDRGITLGGAYVTERIMPGVVYQDHGARLDIITDRINRGGDNNVLSPLNPLSKNCWGMACNAFLVDIEKLDPKEMEEWRKQYPEAFNRDYDPAYGLKFSAWVEEDV